MIPGPADRAFELNGGRSLCLTEAPVIISVSPVSDASVVSWSVEPMVGDEPLVMFNVDSADMDVPPARLAFGASEVLVTATIVPDAVMAAEACRAES